MVDDAPENLAILEAVLEDLDATVVCAESGAEAIDLAAEAIPDLVLLDIMMPGMDGYETLVQLRAQPGAAQTPVIFLSALDDWDQRVKGLELGALDYIVKPFHPADVLVRVRNQLELQSLRRKLTSQNDVLEHELSVARELLRAADERALGPLIGSSVAVVRLREQVATMGSHLEPLMLIAPKGAGAEGVARAIHRSSVRADRRFIHVVCPVQPDLNEAGLIRPRTDGTPAKLELARGGTLFLEDLHTLTPDALERLADGLLSTESEQADSELSESVQDPARLIISVSGVGLDVLPPALRTLLGPQQIALPELSQRRPDLEALIQHYVGRLSLMLGRPFSGVSESTLKLFGTYHWPGNLDELQSLLKSAAFATTEDTLVVDERMLRPESLGSYALIECLQSGAMGEVWRARHRLLARPAAIKLIRRETAQTTGRRLAVRLFQREAKATAELASPHTVRLYDYGVTGNGTFYYVMELLEGLDLRELVERFGPLAPARAAFLAGQACGSLAEAHDRGLVHRDIKPSNLFISLAGIEYDQLRVLDFGVVKAPLDVEADVMPVGNQVGPTSLRQRSPAPAEESDVRGTPAYMAPDALIEERRTVDHRADIYSLGCTLFFALTGRAPFEEATAARAVMRHATEAPASPSSVAPQQNIPPELDALVLQCMSKSRTNRPQNAVELRELLAAIPFPEPWDRAQARQWWQAHAGQMTHMQQRDRRRTPIPPDGSHNSTQTIVRLHEDAT